MPAEQPADDDLVVGGVLAVVEGGFPVHVDHVVVDQVAHDEPGVHVEQAAADWPPDESWSWRPARCSSTRRRRSSVLFAALSLLGLLTIIGAGTPAHADTAPAPVGGDVAGGYVLGA